MIVTKEFLDRGKSARGGWNKKQLAVLGVHWPPRADWQRVLIGKMYRDEIGEKFLLLAGDSPAFDPPQRGKIRQSKNHKFTQAGTYMNRQPKKPRFTNAGMFVDPPAIYPTREERIVPEKWLTCAKCGGKMQYWCESTDRYGEIETICPSCAGY